MGIFGDNSLDMSFNEMSEYTMNALQEAFFYDDMSRLPYEVRKGVLESAEVEIMEEKGLIGRATKVRLSKNDDLERRIGMASIQMAKDSDDLLYDKLVLNRVKEKELLGKIDKKYAVKATKLAKLGQKQYLKNKIPLGIIRK